MAETSTTVTSVIAKSIAVGIVALPIFLAQRHDDSALAAAAATLPIGTIIGYIAFGSADPAGAQSFARSAVLALPVWAAFAIATFALTRVVDWRLAVGAGALVWLGAALIYLDLTH
jgi:uncharacterized membrane protein (GlpM family)